MKLAGMLGVVVILVAVLLLCAIVYGVYFLYIVKFRTEVAKPNEALLVTGKDLGKDAIKNDKGNYVKIVRGGLVRLKFQQHAEPIPLNSFQLKISVQDIMVVGEDKVDAEATSLISIGDTDEHILRYAEQFMGKPQETIETEVREILTTHLRAILTTLAVPVINSNREEFNKRVQDIAQSDLDSLGFKISSFGLGSLDDSDKEGGYLHNAERKRKASMKKEAEIAESEASRETRIKLAEDDKLAKEVENERAIEVAESDKLKALKEATIIKDKAKALAEAETAEELERVAQKKRIVEEQRKVNELQAEADKQLSMIRAEEQKEIALKKAQQDLEEAEKHQERLRVENESKAQIEIKKSQANSEVEISKAKAHYEVEIESARAESEKKRLDNMVEIERTEKLGKAEADAILSKGKAEAEVVLARGRAELEIEEALAEIKLKTSDIYLKEKAIEQLPAMATALGTAIGAIGEVKVIQTGGGENPTESMTGALVTNMVTPFELIKETTGIDIGKLAVNKSNQTQVNIEK